MRDQSSVRRLLEGTAATLDAQVLPQVDDPFTRRQLGAAIELLRYLAPRADWSAGGPDTGAVLAAARAAGWNDPGDDAGAACAWLAAQDPERPGVRDAQAAARAALLAAAEADRADRDHTMFR